MALVETRRRTFRPSASEMKVTLHRFGRNRRLVLGLEWLPLWSPCAPLGASSQRRGIAKSSSVPRLKASGFINYVHPGNRGRIGGERQGVKEGVALLPRPGASQKDGLPRG